MSAATPPQSLRDSSPRGGASWLGASRSSPAGGGGPEGRRGPSAALAEARLWLGTPYQHQASLRGVGCDCLGLVRGLWRALHGAEPEPPPPYRPDWAELGERELLAQALGRWLSPIALTDVQPGDVLLFRMAPDAPAKHCAIASDGERMIHAYWGRACVESWLGAWWRRRLVAAFRFPEPF